MRDIEFGPWAMAGALAAVAAMAWWLPAVPLVLLGLTVLVLAHEGGHLAAARRTGMHATEFFAGFGPVVLAWRTRSGLRVGLKAIPAGGYVKVVGMTAKEQVAAEHVGATFREASRGRRLAVVLAGPIVNLVIGVGLLVVAAAADPLPDQGSGPLGAVAMGWEQASGITVGTMEGVGRLVTNLGDYVTALGDPSDRAAEIEGNRFLSPIGVAQISDDIAETGGFWWIVRLAALASIGLGVMNLLPFPPLDGGHAAIVAAEAVAARTTRQPSLRLDVATRGIRTLTAVTLVFVLGLGASAIVFDVASPLSL